MTANTDDDADDLDYGETLRALRDEVEPPADLEERTVAALQREGLLGMGRPGSSGSRGPGPVAAVRRTGSRAAWQIALAAGVAAILIGGGFLWGQRTVAVPGEPDYLLVLRAGSPEGQARDEADAADRRQEYVDWARAQARSGRLLAGEELSDGGRLLIGAPDDLQARPMAAAGIEEGSVQGYFLIRSASYEEAVRVASGCPHLRFGGTIELRRIHHGREGSG